MNKHKRSTMLACFSPPVMMATFLFEVFSAIYVVVRYKMSKIGRSILGLLLCLALFQFAEYFVCTNSAIAMTASRAGFAAITVLPALGLYLMTTLTKPMVKQWNMALAVVTVMIASYFLVSPSAFDAYTCTGNYVIFQIGHGPALVYSIFYFGLLALSLARGARFLAEKHKPKDGLAVKWLIAGYLLFIVPVAVLTVLHPNTRRAVPSIMCGFAISLALVLAVRVAPLKLTSKLHR